MIRYKFLIISVPGTISPLPPSSPHVLLATQSLLQWQGCPLLNFRLLITSSGEFLIMQKTLFNSLNNLLIRRVSP